MIIVRVPCPTRSAVLAVVAASAVSCAHPIPAPATGTSATAASSTAPAVSGLSSPSPASRVAGLRTCPARQLTIRLIYGGPAAGTIGGVIGFSNTSRSRCELAGWPALVAVGPARTTRAEHTLDVFAGPMLTRPPVVTLKPGAFAVAVLAGGDQPMPGSAKCPAPFRRLLVAPPSSTHATAVSAWIPNFGAYLPACSPIQISPVIPASDLPFLPPRHRSADSG